MRYLKLFLVVIFIIFEEVIWNRIGQPIYEAIKSLGIMTQFRSWVLEIKHRYDLLVIFLAPFIVMEIVGLLSLKAFAMGAIFLGIFLYIFKMLLTIPVVIIFNTAETELRSFYLIDWGYGLIVKIKQSETFLTVKRHIATIKAEIGRIRAQHFTRSELTRLSGVLKHRIKPRQ